MRAHRALARDGYGLLIQGTYRPWYVTWMFSEATPDAQRTFVANPASGSRYTRGSAVDLTLYDLASGRAVRMPGNYVEFTERAYVTYAGGSESERAHRELLRRAMEAQGFIVNPTEWWHFDYHEWREYPVLNTPFERIR